MLHKIFMHVYKIETIDRYMYCGLQCDRLAGGLQKIAEASEQLAVLNDRLAVQKVAVEEKTLACENMLKEISSGTEEATEKKTLAQAKGKDIEEQNVVIAVEKVLIHSSYHFENHTFEVVGVKP